MMALYSIRTPICRRMATQFLLFLTLLLVLLPIPAVHSSPSSEPDALLHLITALGLPPLRPPCQTTGVTCSSADSATSISLPSRGLSGSLSPSVGLLSSLEILILRGNSLSGRVPSSISALSSSLRVLDLSLNRFDGDVGFLAHLHSLEVLDLSGNRFAGAVPPAVSSFRDLVSLNLSGNPGLVVGPFPKLPPLEAVAGGYFPLRGTGGRRYILEEEGAASKKNSTAKRETNGSATAAPPSPSPSPEATYHRRKKVKVWSWLLGFIVGAVVGVVSGVISSVFLRLIVDCVRGRFRDPAGVQMFSSLISAEDVEFLKKEEEVAKLEVIGHGGCGKVYRSVVTRGGTLPSKVIAIKKIKKVNAAAPDTAAEVADEESRMLDKYMRQLQSEIKTVGHIRHRNLLPLLAHVPRPTCNYLVYEYMKNGSLQDAMKKEQLLLRRYGDEPSLLAWETRFKIAEGIAAGLEYLHWQHKPRIIHRDLKPGNILLDDDFEARIADFGFAKAMPDAKTHVTSSHIAGTVGYIAPEYHQTLKFTDKCDVYSFGVILAGLALGKAPSDAYFQITEEMSLVRWLRNVMRAGEETAREVVDERLRGSGHEEEMVLVLKIACFCTADDPRERPSSKEVRCMLQQVKARGLLQRPLQP